MCNLATTRCHAGSPLSDWEHIALELAPAWLAALTAWQPYTAAEQRALGPRLLRGNLDIATEPADTFFDYDCSSCQVRHEIWSLVMGILPPLSPVQDWKHGAVFVNGFNVGRYHTAGPQKTLYIPGPLLRPGTNEILVFENYLGSDTMTFTDTPNYGTPSSEPGFSVNNKF